MTVGLPTGFPADHDKLAEFCPVTEAEILIGVPGVVQPEILEILACQPDQDPVEQLLLLSDVNLKVNCPFVLVAVIVPGELVPV